MPASPTAAIRAATATGSRFTAAAGLIALALAGAAAVAQPVVGNVERGRALLLQRHDTGCILCHRVAGMAVGGDLGPSLEQVAVRHDAAALRERIADARRYNPETIMPPTRSTEALHAVAPAYRGRPLLTEQALADIVAYLLQPEAAMQPPARQGSDARLP